VDGAVPTPVYDTPESYSKVTSKFNLSYEFSPAALVYANAAQGFRGGGLNPQSQPFEPIPPSFGPDSLWSYELGLKGRLFDGMFDYQTDVYEIIWSNIQLNVLSPGGFNYTANAGEARVKGWEYEINARPVQGLTVSLTGTWTEAYLSRGATPDQYTGSGEALGLTGTNIPNVPHFSGSANARYVHALGADLQGSVGMDISYRGREDSYFSSDPENIPMPAYFLTNVRAGLDWGLWNATAFVRNLSNRRPEISLLNSDSGGVAVFTARPRTVGVSVTRKF
jgi:iron complex outermembrane recepter protein